MIKKSDSTRVAGNLVQYVHTSWTLNIHSYTTCMWYMSRSILNKCMNVWMYTCIQKEDYQWVLTGYTYNTYLDLSINCLCNSLHMHYKDRFTVNKSRLLIEIYISHKIEDWRLKGGYVVILRSTTYNFHFHRELRARFSFPATGSATVSSSQPRTSTKHKL